MHHKIVLLAGGTGLIGTRLQMLLREKGYQVRILTRHPQEPHEFAWDPLTGAIDTAAVDQVDYIVNLAGAGIAEKRWTPDRKRLIIESRVEAARVLASAVMQHTSKPQAYISASAIGYYGNSGESLMQEQDTPTDDNFLVQSCRQWEAAADGFSTLNIRVVKLRIGVVLAKEGGALAEVLKPMRFGLAAYFDRGQAWWSWIHRDDLCNIIIWSMENQEVSGVFNAVAPHPVRNLEMTKAIVAASGYKAIVAPAPSIALRLALGEMSAVVLNSNNISSEKIEAAGFQFQFPELQGALKHIFVK